MFIAVLWENFNCFLNFLLFLFLPLFIVLIIVCCETCRGFKAQCASWKYGLMLQYISNFKSRVFESLKCLKFLEKVAVLSYYKLWLCSIHSFVWGYSFYIYICSSAMYTVLCKFAGFFFIFFWHTRSLERAQFYCWLVFDCVYLTVKRIF